MHMDLLLQSLGGEDSGLSLGVSVSTSSATAGGLVFLLQRTSSHVFNTFKQRRHLFICTVSSIPLGLRTSRRWSGRLLQLPPGGGDKRREQVGWMVRRYKQHPGGSTGVKMRA